MDKFKHLQYGIFAGTGLAIASPIVARLFPSAIGIQYTLLGLGVAIFLYCVIFGSIEWSKTKSLRVFASFVDKKTKQGKWLLEKCDYPHEINFEPDKDQGQYVHPQSETDRVQKFFMCYEQWYLSIQKAFERIFVKQYPTVFSNPIRTVNWREKSYKEFLRSDLQQLRELTIRTQIHEIVENLQSDHIKEFESFICP